MQHLTRTAQEQVISGVQTAQEIGGLVGRILLAYLAAVIISRRRLLHIFQIPGLIVLPVVFLLVPTVGLTLAQWGIFIIGMLTIAQFSFWGNYLPRVYPTHLRGTGESFAANVGGRMIGTFAALVTTTLVAVHARTDACRSGSPTPARWSAHGLRASASRPASSCPSRSERRMEGRMQADVSLARPGRVPGPALSSEASAWAYLPPNRKHVIVRADEDLSVRHRGRGDLPLAEIVAWPAPPACVRHGPRSSDASSLTK